MIADSSLLDRQCLDVVAFSNRLDLDYVEFPPKCIFAPEIQGTARKDHRILGKMVKESYPAKIAHRTAFTLEKIQPHALPDSAQLIYKTEQSHNGHDHKLAADFDDKVDLGHRAIMWRDGSPKRFFKTLWIVPSREKVHDRLQADSNILGGCVQSSFTEIRRPADEVGGVGATDCVKSPMERGRRLGRAHA